jgi:hypothetical protein
MKLKSTLVAMFSLATLTVSQAFYTIDFNALVPTGEFSIGDTISSNAELDIEVDGYGTVTFLNNSNSTVGDNVLVIGETYTNGEGSTSSLEMESGESVTVIFKGDTVTNVQAGFAGASATPFDTGALIAVEEGVTYTAMTIDVATITQQYGGSDGVGLEFITWNVVPEPSSAALGAIGLTMILFRRRSV